MKVYLLVIELENEKQLKKKKKKKKSDAPMSKKKQRARYFKFVIIAKLCTFKRSKNDSLPNLHLLLSAHQVQ